MLIELAQKAKEAASFLAVADTKTKNEALLAVADALIKNKDYILSENKKDLQKAEKKGTKPAMLDRLMLNEQRILAMAEGLEKVVALEDPVGFSDSQVVRPNGLEIKKVRVHF